MLISGETEFFALLFEWCVGVVDELILFDGRLVVGRITTEKVNVRSSSDQRLPYFLQVRVVEIDLVELSGKLGRRSGRRYVLELPECVVVHVVEGPQTRRGQLADLIHVAVLVDLYGRVVFRPDESEKIGRFIG